MEAARPVLDALVGTVQETGGSGSAQLARAAYTLQTSAQIMSAIEADALYRAVQRSSVRVQPAASRRSRTTSPTASFPINAYRLSIRAAPFRASFLECVPRASAAPIPA